MGVKLPGILPTKNIEWSDLEGKKVGIDFSNVCYQFLSSIRQRDGTPLMDSHGNVTSHLSGIFYRSLNLMQKGILLTYIFDGKPPELKLQTQEKRRERKEKAREKYTQAKDEKDIDSMYKYAKQVTYLNNEMIQESKDLIKALGLPVIQSPSESDAQGAFMTEQGDIWAFASSDADCLLHGCPRTIPNLTLSEKRKISNGNYVYIKPELIELEEVLSHFNINQDQLITLGILVGSVDHNEPTIIKNSGTIKVMPIGNCPQDHPLEVPCFDLETKKIKFKKVKKFIKHEISEPLFEITTGYNRRVRVTKSHSLFIKSDKGIKAVKTTDLKKGDKLVVPVRIPVQNKEIKEIILVQELWKHKDRIKRLIYCDGKGIQEIRKRRLLNKDKRLADKRYILTKLGLKRLKRLRIDKKIAQRKTPISESTILDWEKGRRNPTETKFREYLNFLGTNIEKFNNENKSINRIRNSSFEENIFPILGLNKKNRKTLLLKTLSKEEVNLLSEQDFIYGRSRTKNPISAIIKVTPELIRLIGYFLAEGHLNGDYRVNFSFALDHIGHDDYCVKDVVCCIKKIFKINPKVYHEKSTRHICIDNCIVYDIFAYVLELEKQNSKTKKIPHLILNISPKLQLEFLKGLFLGDGSLTKNSIRFNTRSYDMAVGLSYMFLQQGILSTTTFLKEKNYNMKALSICGKEQLINLKEVWQKHNKAKILINHCKKPLKQKPYMEIDGDLGYVKIKSIIRVKPSNSYVYDFSVDGENFIAGFGGVCCHNTDYNPGGIKGIGPKKALNLVHQHKDFEKLFKELNPEFNWKQIYAIFKSMPIMKNYQLKWTEPNREKILDILVDKHEFSQERVEKMLNELIKKPKQQTGLSSWMK